MEWTAVAISSFWNIVFHTYQNAAIEMLSNLKVILPVI